MITFVTSSKILSVYVRAWIRNTRFTHLLHFCSTSKEISKHWPGPLRSQWPTGESLFSCPKFLFRPRIRGDPRGGQGWEWWRNWCTGRHSGPSPVSVLPLFSPHCTVWAGPPTRACVLAGLGYSFSLVRTKPTLARCSHGPLRVLAEQMVGVGALGYGRQSRWQNPDKRVFSAEATADTSAYMSWRGGERKTEFGVVWCLCVKFQHSYAQR